MRTLPRRLVVPLVLITATFAFAKPPKERLGVFGAIHGKPFNAISNGQASDSCVSGIFKPADALFTMAALECRSRRKARIPKKNYKILALACSQFDQNASRTPPYEIPCIAGSFTEHKKLRRTVVPIGVWLVTTALDQTTFFLTSTVNLRVESFDGAILRAKVFGVFDSAQTGTGVAAITGETEIAIPVQVQ